MPGYIGFRPQFNPLSLQEVLAVPTTILGEYSKAEEQYNETTNKAEALKALLGERNADNEAGWQIVDRYEGLIKDAADAMAATGIQGPEGYRQAKKAGTYYRQNMLPLESGINALQTDEKELRARDKDGTLVRKRKYSLNDYIKNPNLRSDSVLGSSIQAEAMKAAATASARRKSEPLWGKAGGNQYHSITTLTGFSPEEVQNWMLYRKTNPDKVSPELNEIYNQIATKFTDAGYDIRDIDDYITRGIYDGIAYDNKVEYQKNLAYETPAQRTARLGTDVLPNMINDYLNNSSQWGNVGIELNVGLTGRKDLNDKRGNLARVENGKVVGIKTGGDFTNAFGTIRIKPQYGNTAGYPQQITLNEEYLFDENGKLRTPEELKQYIKSKFAIKKGTRLKTDDNKYYTASTDTPFETVYRDFDVNDYSKVYQQLIDAGFNPSQQFGVNYQEGVQRINGKSYPVSTRSFDKKSALRDFQSYANNLYQGNDLAQTNSNGLNTQFGFYTYPVNINNMERFIREMPSTQLYEFDGMTTQKDPNTKQYIRVPKLGKHASKVALQEANKNKNIGLHMSYDPVTKGFIWYTNDENPKYWYMKAADLDRTIPTQDYTNVDFQRAAAYEKMLNEEIQRLLSLYQANPNNFEVNQKLYALLTELKNSGNINQGAYNLLMSGLDRSFFQKWGTHTVNTSNKEEEQQQSLMEQYLMMP